MAVITQIIAGQIYTQLAGDDNDDDDEIISFIVVQSPQTARTRNTIQKESRSSQCSAVLH